MTKTRSEFLSKLQVEVVDAKRWRLLSDLILKGRLGDIIVVKAGTITDFATVPQWLQSIFPKIGAWTEASVVHDELIYRLERYRRALKRWKGSKLLRETTPPPEPPLINSRDTDGIFRMIMEDRGVHFVTRWLAWAAVRWAALFSPARWGGWWHWPTTAQLAGVSLAALVVLVAIVRLVTWVVPW